jgi:hypothetical protein
MAESSLRQGDVRTTCCAMPRVVRTAGMIWIIFGSIQILSALLNFGISGDLILNALSTSDGQLVLATIGIGLFFGAVFLQVGIQSMKGTAKGSLGNGIGSLFFGVLNSAWGIYLISLTLQVNLYESARYVSLALSSIPLLSGVGLLVAGFLALNGAGEYKAWKQGLQVLTPD